jgi:hypothetical protein
MNVEEEGNEVGGRRDNEIEEDELINSFRLDWKF